MGKARKRSEDQLRTQARTWVEDLPAETAAGRLEGGDGRMPNPGQQREAIHREHMKEKESGD